MSLTAVFGMGTGGPSSLMTLTYGAPSGIQPRDASRSHMIKTAVALATALFLILAAFGAPSGIRTRDPLIKSQLLYQLS